MKGKILTFVIGLLVGAIITTVGFLIYSKIVADNSNQPEMIQMDGNGQMGRQQAGNMEQPPERPDGESSAEPPAKPEEMNTNASN